MQNELLDKNILKNLEKLHFRVKKRFLGKNSGNHITLKKGQGIEFSDFRAYTLSDNPKNIDWNIFAKTEKLYVKEFKEYQNLNFFIYQDISSSMDFPKNNTNLTTALKLVTALSYIALINNEDLTIATQEKLLLSKISGKLNFNLVLNALKNIEPVKEDFFNDKLSLYLDRIKFPGIAICISDFLTPFDMIKKGLDKIRSKNLSIYLIKIEDLDFTKNFEDFSAKFIDSETNEEKTLNLNNNVLQNYLKNYNNHIEKIKTYAKKYDIKFYTLNKNDDLLNFLTSTNLCY